MALFQHKIKVGTKPCLSGASEHTKLYTRMLIYMYSHSGGSDSQAGRWPT